MANTTQLHTAAHTVPVQAHQDPKKLSVAIFSVMMCVALIMIVCLVIGMSLLFQSSVTKDTLQLLNRQSTTMVSELNKDARQDEQLAYLQTVEWNEVRATYIAADGTVLFDSEAAAQNMENHAQRPEVAAAFAQGSGTATRASTTEGMVSLYVANRLVNGSVLRLAYARPQVLTLLQKDPSLSIVLLVISVALSYVASRYLAWRLTRPILRLDMSTTRQEAPYAELVPLVDKLHEQHSKIMRQVSELKAADSMRAEFTANITHELKTPIATISGAAELIKDGVARPEDVPSFAMRIYDEAQRLTALVNDILILSRMDASERLQDRALVGQEEVIDLFTLARDSVERHEDEAHKAQVELSLSGGSAKICGNARLLDEMVSNLVENALRYTPAGGYARVSVEAQGSEVYLSVTDNGVGMSQEDQLNAFKRFYRADKGRSRETGGTGLGLAIVKHAATFHNAEISLTSKLGRGTTVMVRFKKAPERH